MNSKPSISIGVPVFNNAVYLHRMIESVLAQEYSNFDLIISDDCSTDNSEEICKHFAEKDKRVRYFRNESNLGAIKNHQRVLDLAESEYFMFARGHEILPSDLLSCAMNVLENQKEVVLACAYTRWIDEKDNLVENKYLPLFDTRGCDVITRCLLAMWGKCEAFYGVGLRRQFNAVQVLKPIVGTDLVMIMEMSLIGSIAVLPCGDRLRRYHYSESYQERVARHQKDMLGETGFIDKYFPIIRLPFAIFGSVWRGKISILQKLAISLLFIVCFPIKYFISRDKAL